MATNDVNNFKAKFTGGGARPNRFRVLLTFPGYVNGDTELASFMTKAASLPGVTLGEITVPFRGRQTYWPGDKTFEPWSITVINDTNFSVRDALIAWSDGINDNTTNASTVDVQNWFSDLVVEQLDLDSETVLKRYKMIGAYPTAISEIALANESGDSIEEFTCQFRYISWSEIK